MKKCIKNRQMFDKANSKWFNKVLMAIIARVLEDNSVKRVHEVGCGFESFLSNSDDMELDIGGLDFFPTAINRAKEIRAK